MNPLDRLTILQRVDRALDLLERAIVAYESRPQLGAPRKRAAATVPKGPAPGCPDCGAEMKVRYRKSDSAPFYGCSEFPDPSNGSPFADEDNLPF